MPEPKGKQPEKEEPTPPNQPPSSTAKGSSTASGTSSNATQTRTSWSGGSWRGKATAVAEIARESIPGNTASEIASRTGNALRSPSKRLSRSLNSPGKSNLSPACATPLHVTPDGSSEERGEGSSEKPMSTEDKEKGIASGKDTDKGTYDGIAGKDGNVDDSLSQEKSLAASGWRGWWSRPKQEHSGNEKTDQPDVAEIDKKLDTIAQNNNVDKLSEESTTRVEPINGVSQDVTEQQQLSEEGKPVKPQRSSWFGLWGFSTATDEDTATDMKRSNSHKGESVEASATTVDAAPEPSQSSNQTAKEQLTSRPVSGSWAFWSRERSQTGSKSDGGVSEPRKEVGELAVSGTDSQSKPRPAQLSQEKGVTLEEGSKKRRRPASSETSEGSSKKSVTAKQANSDSSGDIDLPPQMQQSVLKTTVQQPKAKSKKTSQESTKPPTPNIILPSFDDAYPMSTPLSYLSRLSRYIPYGPASMAPQHLFRSPQPHRIRHALAIGKPSTFLGCLE